MKYTVVWLPAALMELATVWNDADDRGDVTAASDEIDRQLSVGPRLVGESRGGNRRVLFARPLAIDYQIAEEDRMVTVLAVWYSR
jgi:plasmid stabilization system protein ParE